VLGFTFAYIGKIVTQKNEFLKEYSKLNKSLMASNNLLETFNSHVSHDLKTVLNNQLALAKMSIKYSKLNDGSKVEEISTKILTTSESGLDMVHNFLAISKEGFLTHGIPMVEVDICEFIQAVIVKNNLQDKLILRIGKTDFTRIKTHEKILESVFLNILTNSIKYSTKFPEVDIDLVEYEAGRSISFKDNGIGIDLAKEGGKLFQPFSRLTNSREKEGTGIGLFMVKKLVEAYGGKIQVKSQPNKGTTVTISFKFKPKNQA
jgi:signal transduction histidine kinase